MKQQYDVVVIGAGSAGLTAASGFQKVGKSVLLVEREHMGGECTNTGCVPSKALLHAAKARYSAPEAFAYVRQTIDNILEEETPEVFQARGIDVVMGDAVFTSKCAVTVGDTTYGYKTAVIATGSSPRMVDIKGLQEKHILTNQNIFTLEDIPKRLLVIGGGPIGMEMAQAFASLGSDVTIAERGDQFARLEDPAVQPIIRRAFEKLGVTIKTGANITHVDGQTAHFNQVDGDAATDTFTVDFDYVLVAIGRVPNLPQGLEHASIDYDTQCIKVDSQYRTSNKYVYAIGDVSQRLKFTHTADDIARQVVARVASRGLLKVNTKKAVPKVTYTTPEVAQVGLSWDAAVREYGEERIMRIEVPFDQNDRAKTDDKTDGILVVIARRIGGQVIGAHIAGPAAGEILSIFTLAIDQKISLWKLQKLIYAYPTYSLVVKKAADQFVGRQLGDLKPDLIAVLKRNAPKLIAAIFWVSLIYAFQSYRTTNDLSYVDLLFQLIDFFTTSFWGPVIYMVLYAIRPLILFPATLLTALSGALFGLWWGIIYTVIGENASANFAYWIGRFFGQGLKLEDSIIGNWVTKLRENTFEAVLLMRLFYFPFDLTNYGAGVVRGKWREYFFATLIGIMPGLVTFVALGAAVDLTEFREMGLSFDAFDPKFLALSVVIFVASLGLSRFLKRWKAHD